VEEKSRKLPQTTENTTITHKQEAFLLKLLTSPTMQAACDECAMSYETARRWMLLPAVQSRYQELRQAYVDEALTALVRHTDTAIATLARNMTDRETPPAVQVRSAQLILEQVLQINKISTLEKDVEELKLLLKERNV
jgi:hypothetical protein